MRSGLKLTKDTPWVKSPLGRAFHCYNICIQGGPKSYTFLVFEFPPYLDALYLQLLFTHVPFLLNDIIVTYSSSSAGVNEFCFYANKL